MATTLEATQECPFLCGRKFGNNEEYALALHIEEEHTDDSPFVVCDDTPVVIASGVGPTLRLPLARQSESQEQGKRSATDLVKDVQHRFVPADHVSPASNQPSPLPSRDAEVDDGGADSTGPSDEYVMCPEGGCGEQILLFEYSDHLDLHLAEKATLDDFSSSSLTQASSSNKMQSSLHNHSLDDYSSSPSSVRASHASSASASAATTESSPPQSHMDNFSTSISPALRKKFAASSSDVPADMGEIRRPLSSTSHERKRKGGKLARLGKAELGPYAFEDRMPKWLYSQMEQHPRVFKKNIIGCDGRIVTIERNENETAGAVPMLARLSELDTSVEKAWFCHPCVLHVSKYNHEGGFCGYRNIQMAISYLQGSKAPSHQIFPDRIPTVIQLQEWIESAWNDGVNDYARSQVGKLKGTRKWIGTTETSTLFEYLGIPCNQWQCYDEKIPQDRAIKVRFADDILLDKVEAYFKEGIEDPESPQKVHRMYKAPLYLQHRTHSLTVVGLERRKDGSRNLLVFDPVFQTPEGMQKLLEKRMSPLNLSDRSIGDVMRVYRRGASHLGKYKEFEVLYLDVQPPMFPAWDVYAAYSFNDPLVYAFLDISTNCYEIVPESDFTPMFPWQECGSLFIAAEARFARGPTIPGYCVPAIWSRHVSIDSNPLHGPWQERYPQVLEYDRWRTPESIQTLITNLFDENGIPFHHYGLQDPLANWTAHDPGATQESVWDVGRELEMNDIAEYLWPKVFGERWEYDASAAETLQRKLFAETFLEPNAWECFAALKPSGWI